MPTYQCNMKTKMFFAVLALSATSCMDPVEPFGGAQAVLEIEYINYAWTPTYRGFVVDVFGNVYSYDRQGRAWEHQDRATLTQEQLESKFTGKTLVATRLPSEVEVMGLKAQAAASGALSERKMQCADAGILTYRAYVVEGDPPEYRPVLLRVEGDVAQVNTSESAQEVIAYIRSLKLMDELLGCDPE